MNAFNPELLTLAREYRQITQEDLERLSGVPQHLISRIENAQATPDSETINQIAQVIDLPATFFHQSYVRSAMPLELYRRKKLPLKLSKAASAQAGIQLMCIRTLLEATTVVPERIRRIDIEEDYKGSFSAAANDLRLQWNLELKPIKNLTNLLEAAGIYVVPTTFASPTIDGLSIDDPGLPPIIFVKADLPADRWRWTVAHEFAHLLFHHHKFLPGTALDFDREADQFAAEFLLPEGALRTRLSDLDVSRLGELKLEWEVAMQSLFRRAASLGYITRYKEGSFYKLFNARGWMRDEPFKFPREQPVLFNRVFHLYETKLNYTAEDLCDLLNLNMNEMHRLFPGAIRGPALKRIK